MSLLLPKNINLLLPKIAHFSNILIPNKIQEKVITLAINNVLKEALEDGELDFLEDKRLEIKVTDISKSWYFTLVDEQIFVSMDLTESDVTISGQFNEFILLASQKVDPDTLFFKRKLLIEGDVELGLAVKNLLDRVELTQLPAILSKPLVVYADTLLS